MQRYALLPAPPDIVDEALRAYSPLVRKLLFRRGVETAAAAEKFLTPDYERDVHDPFLLKGMERAVERIERAIAAGEKIIVYGDYDCDGIPGSVIMHDFFKKIGYENFENYIPHRHEEGYGLHEEAVSEFAKKGATLLITVDCGIADVNAVSHAESLGINVILTDHHLPQEKLPPAYALINPKQDGDAYPDKMLCGAGLAWKLVQALIRHNPRELKEGWEKWLLDMAGLSTIADMVPLQNENRVLAHFGLTVLRKSPRPGLMKLLRKMNVAQEFLTEDDIGFMVAPRINAASRMDVPIEAFRLLSTADESVADALSDHLHRLNDERKGAVAAIMKETKRALAGRAMRPVIVVGNPKWRVGVLGIVANNLCDEYERPAFVWGREGSAHIKGSCRSDGTVNVVELMTAVSEDMFLNLGGHELSGGFSVSHEKVHLLEDALVAAYEKIKRERPKEERAIDAILPLTDVSWGTYKDIERMAPFGEGNPKPTFLFEDVAVTRVRNFGKTGNHLEVEVWDGNGKKVKAVGFFMKEDSFGATALAEGEKIDLIATFEKSVFRGNTTLRLRIVDIMKR